MPFFGIATLHFVKQCDQNTATSPPNKMTNRKSAAINVDF